MSIEDKTNNVFGLTVFNNGQFEVKVREVNGQLEFEIDGIAKSLGFSYIRTDRNNKEFIRWKTVNEYLQGFGLSQNVATGDFIPEAYVYLLGMKASNNTAIDFQKWMAFDVIPAIRKHGCFIGENPDLDYIDNEIRFSTKRTIKTFATANVLELNSLYEEFKGYMTSEYKYRTDVRIARYKSVEKGLELLHDDIAKKDIARIGDCYNIRLLQKQVILDRTKLEKKSLGGDKAGKTKKIMALQDRLDCLDPDLEDHEGE
jgi:prophage antirepressor-like protein